MDGSKLKTFSCTFSPGTASAAFFASVTFISALLEIMPDVYEETYATKRFLGLLKAFSTCSGGLHANAKRKIKKAVFLIVEIIMSRKRFKYEYKRKCNKKLVGCQFYYLSVPFLLIKS